MNEEINMNEEALEESGAAGDSEEAVDAGVNEDAAVEMTVESDEMDAEADSDTDSDAEGEADPITEAEIDTAAAVDTPEDPDTTEISDEDEAVGGTGMMLEGVFMGEVDEPAEEDDGRAWYVVHCYSSYENKVRHNLEQRIESMGMKDRIFDVVVPVEEEIEVRDGRRRTIERRVFPGYILVYMILTEESWYVVRNTPGVTGFVGQGNTPIPLRPEEVAHIVKRMEAETPRIKVTFKQGERVRIIDGPFNDFRGTVSEIDMERAKVRVMVNFFGRETPVELDFLQVEKA